VKSGKKKNYHMDKVKIKKIHKITGTKTEIETPEMSLDMLMFKAELLESLRTVSGKDGVKG